MSARGIEVNFRINFPVIFIAVLVAHALLLSTNSRTNFSSQMVEKAHDQRNDAIQIKDIRTVGVKNGKRKDSVFVPSKPPTTVAPSKGISLSDLKDTRPVSAEKIQRPGTRPEVAKSALTAMKTLPGISLKGDQELQRMARGQSAAKLSGDPRTAGLNNTDVLVNLEVPEGVSEDKLNEYELMFYGFQRRTAVGYVNSFYKSLDKFQRENPHLKFPMTENKQTMTGRITYDSKGNIVQIKMVRWSNVDRLQDFFVDVLKDMDTLHNPPQTLWEKNGEFSIFFTLVVNG